MTEGFAETADGNYQTGDMRMLCGQGGERAHQDGSVESVPREDSLKMLGRMRL